MPTPAHQRFDKAQAAAREREMLELLAEAKVAVVACEISTMPERAKQRWLERVSELTRPRTRPREE